jgi:hypothetical protein
MVLWSMMVFWIMKSCIWVSDYHQPDCMVSQPRRPQSKSSLSLKLQVSVLEMFNGCAFEVLMECIWLICSVSSVLECCKTNFMKFLYTPTAVIQYLIYHVVDI